VGPAAWRAPSRYQAYDGSPPPFTARRAAKDSSSPSRTTGSSPEGDVSAHSSATGLVGLGGTDSTGADGARSAKYPATSSTRPTPATPPTINVDDRRGSGRAGLSDGAIVICSGATRRAAACGGGEVVRGGGITTVSS